jgi:NitT/TauT family transport system ATP-binding protein
MAEFLKATDIRKSFQTKNGPLTVIDGLSLTQRAGELVTIVGASGSGKTTFLRIVAGLESADSGEVALNGAVLTGPGPERAMVFQQFGLMPWLTVRENILFGLATQSMSKSEREDRVRDAVKRVGLNGFEDFHPKELSGGMQQRVGIARALAVRPALLLCDEPFAAVDAMTRQVMQNDLLRVVTEEKAAALLVTHDIEEAIFLGDRVIVLSSRPARLIEEIAIDIPKPREHKVRATPYFQELRERVWSLLQSQME